MKMQPVPSVMIVWEYISSN